MAKRLTEAQVGEMLKLARAGMTQTDIAARMGINKGTVCRRLKQVEQAEQPKERKASSKPQTAPQATEQPQAGESKAEPEKPLNEADTKPDKVEQKPDVRKTESDNKPQEPDLDAQPIQTMPDTIKPAETENTQSDGKPDKKEVLSIRTRAAHIKMMRAYALAADMSMETLIISAVREYVADHPLSGDSETIFRLLMKRRK